MCACVHERAYVEQAFTTNGSMPLHSCTLNCHLTVYLGNPYTYFCESESCSVVADSLRPHGLYSPWNSACQNTGEGSLSLLQGIFPIQESNPGLLHCKQMLYQLSYEGTRLLEFKSLLYCAFLYQLRISPSVQFSSVQSLSRVRLFVTPWTTLSMEFFRPEYWSG